MKKFHHYGKIFWPSGFTVSAGLSKLTSTCPREQFEGKFFRRKKNIICWRIGTLFEKILDICRTFLEELLQTDFSVNRGTFRAWRKFGRNFFITNGYWAKLFRLLIEKKISRDSRNYNLRVQINTFRIKAFFEKLAFLVTFADSGNRFRPSGKVF